MTTRDKMHIEVPYRLIDALEIIAKLLLLLNIEANHLRHIIKEYISLLCRYL
jgi:hypothetical protein